MSSISIGKLLLPSEIKIENNSSPGNLNSEYYCENNIHISGSDDNDSVPIVEKKVFTAVQVESEPNNKIINSSRLGLDEDRPGVCKLCNTGFPNFDLYNEHMISAHQDKLPFSCRFCKKRFRDLRGKNYHEEAHDESRYSGPPQFSCDLCFAAKDIISRPVWLLIKRSHLEHKDGKRNDKGPFTMHKSRTLARNPHLKPPPRKKVNICSECGITLARWDELRKHMRSHFPNDSGLRVYQCRICGKRESKRKRDLFRHIKLVHRCNVQGKEDILKPYCWGICEKPFYLGIEAVICALMAHDPTQIKNAMFQFKCSRCPDLFGFHNIPSLKRHWVEEHPGKKFPSQHDSGYANLKKCGKNDFPTVFIEKTKEAELRHVNGIPPEVKNSDILLYFKLELLPHLHIGKGALSVVKLKVGKSKESGSSKSSQNDKFTVKVGNMAEINKILNNKEVRVTLSRLRSYKSENELNVRSDDNRL